MRNAYIIVFVLIVASLTFSMTTEGADFVKAYAWPEVPLPNATIDVYAVVDGASSVQVQMCINDLCLLPQDMDNIGNNTYHYKFQPGIANTPPTSDGDIVYYHILVDGNEVFVGNVTVRTNNPPTFLGHYINPVTPKLGDNITVGITITDDFGVHKVNASVKDPSGNVEWRNISQDNDTYYFIYKPFYEGSYFVCFTAWDNSNQSNSSSFRFYVYPKMANDTKPPEVSDIYGVVSGDEMNLTVYIYDESGVMEAKVKVNGKWYSLEEEKPGVFMAKVPKNDTVIIYARDPYNNTLNATFAVKLFGAEEKKIRGGEGGISYILLVLLGLIIGLTVFVPVKSYFLVIPIAIIAVTASFIYSLHIAALEAGGNVYNGNTCWSCLALQPSGGVKGFIVNYPNGTPVNHPSWILDLLKQKPGFIYVHQVPCTGCEIQWKDMVKNGIITEDGKLGDKYRGKIEFVVLDATLGSDTRDKALEVLRIYSLGPPGTPTTVVLTKHSGKIYWFSKGGVVTSDELIKVLNKAIELYGGEI